MNKKKVIKALLNQLGESTREKIELQTKIRELKSALRKKDDMSQPTLENIKQCTMNFTDDKHVEFLDSIEKIVSVKISDNNRSWLINYILKEPTKQEAPVTSKNTHQATVELSGEETFLQAALKNKWAVNYIPEPESTTI